MHRSKTTHRNMASSRYLGLASSSVQSQMANITTNGILKKPVKGREYEQSEQAETEADNDLEEVLDLKAKATPVIAAYKKRPKGETRVQDSRLQYRQSKKDEWHGAVPLDDIRPQLIRQQARYGSYDHPDPQGLGGLNDQTAFKAEHRRWGPDRGDRPNILFCFDEEGDERPSYSPGWMWYQGQVVLDPENEPILDWQEVPLTLSSKTPGYKMEAITRMESRDVCHEDLRARMPKYVLKSKNDRDAWKGLPGTNTTVSMVMSRFRIKAGCVSWVSRGEKTLELREAMVRFHGNSLYYNSTRASRDLKNWEILEAKKGNRGRFMNNAGSRALNEEERLERIAEEDRKIAQGVQKGGDRSSAIASFPRTSGNHSSRTISTSKKQSQHPGDVLRNTTGKIETSFGEGTAPQNAVAQDVTHPRTYLTPSRHSLCRTGPSPRSKVVLGKRRRNKDIDVSYRSDEDDSCRQIKRFRVEVQLYVAKSELKTLSTAKLVRDFGSKGFVTDHGSSFVPIDQSLQGTGNSAALLAKKRTRPTDDLEDFDTPVAKHQRTAPRQAQILLGALSKGGKKSTFRTQHSLKIPRTSGAFAHANIQSREMVRSTDTRNGHSEGAARSYMKDTDIVEADVTSASFADQNMSESESMSSDTKVKDIQEVAPKTRLEVSAINRALEATRKDFHIWTGDFAPITVPTESYASQFRHIELALHTAWYQLNSARAPDLFRLGPWEGGMTEWKLPTQYPPALGVLLYRVNKDWVS